MTEPAAGQMKALVDRLFFLTKSGSLDWKVIPAFGDESEQYSVRIGSNTVYLRGYTDPLDDNFECEVIIKDMGAKEVDRFGGSDLKDFEPPASLGDGYWQALRTLYKMAGRNARGSDKVLDEILSALNNKDNEPF